MVRNWRISDLVGMGGLDGSKARRQSAAAAPSCPEGYSYSQYLSPIAPCPTGMRWHRIPAGNGSCFKCWPKDAFANGGLQ